MSLDKFPCRLTKYGFRWGPVEIERRYSHPNKGAKRAVWIRLKTARQELTVHITPTGFIRIGDGPQKIVKPKAVPKK